MKIGFIGLGIMGRPMAANLIKAGYEVTVYGHNRDVIESLVRLGANSAESEAEVARKSDAVIMMVQNSPQVRTAVTNMAPGLKKGMTIIDMSSIDPVETRAIGKILEGYGCAMLDSPVSGGEPKAIDGTLSAMVGGDEDVFDKYLPVLKSMASSVVRVGNLGAGNVAKLANQMVVACNIAAIAEALTFSVKMDADPDLVFQAIRGGLAGSTAMDAKAPMMIKGEYKPGFRIELHIKDLNNAINAAHSVSSPVPLTASVMEMFSELRALGYEKEDHSALARHYENVSGASIAEK